MKTQVFGFCPGSTTATRDHLTPRSAGGRSTWSNVTAMCLACNTSKGSRSLLDILFDQIVSMRGEELMRAAVAAFGRDTLDRATSGAARRRRTVFWMANEMGILDEILLCFPRRYRGKKSVLHNLSFPPKNSLIGQLKGAMEKLGVGE